MTTPEALIAASTRANGKVLLSHSQATALLREYLRPDAARPRSRCQLCIPDLDALTAEELRIAIEHVLVGRRGDRPRRATKASEHTAPSSGVSLRAWLRLPDGAPMPDEATVWRSAVQRRIDACLCVRFLGHVWHVNHPDCRVGDVVLCLPTRRGVAIRVRPVGEDAPDILAERVDLAASLRNRSRTAQPDCSATNSDMPTTGDALSRAALPLCDGMSRQTQAPPKATPRGRKRIRTSGKARVGSVSRGGSIALALDVRVSLASNTLGSNT